MCRPAWVQAGVVAGWLWRGISVPSSSHLAHSPYDGMNACEQPEHELKPDCGGVVHLPPPLEDDGGAGAGAGHQTAGGFISATSSAVIQSPSSSQVVHNPYDGT